MGGTVSRGTAIGVCTAVALTVAPAAGAQAAGLPEGQTVWIKNTEYGWQMLQIWRNGSKVRIYHDEGGYPGDGFNCSWGTLRGQKFRGKVQRVAPDPLAVRYTITREGKKLRVLGLTGLKEEDRRKWRRSSVKRFNALVPESADNPGTWCRTFSPVS